MTFSSYGVRIVIEADRREPIDWVRARLGALLQEAVETVEGRGAGHRFTVRSAPDGATVLAINDVPIGGHAVLAVALEYLASRIKLAVGELATSHVFVHAGVVGLGSGAVVLPASSCQGKTTLVRELVERGALYYSDDLALVDPQGLVSPFPKALSIRPDDGNLRQVEHAVETLGGVAGDAPLRVDGVLFTHYDPGAQWQPRRIGAGAALLRLMPHTLPIRVAPERSLQALNRMVGGASLWESPRGEVGEVADWIFGSLQQNRSGS